MNQRAITYRRLHAIPESWGTAVNVQAMVFGNMGEDCATGVAFTRDPSTGANLFYGEYLVNAQGEDVVAGIRTPQHLTVQGKEAQKSDAPAMEETMPDGVQAARRGPRPAREALLRHAGHRVHRAARQALHAADAQRQAHGQGRAQDRRRHGARGPDRQEGGGGAHRAGLARPAPAPHARSQGRAQGDRQGPAGLAGRGLGQGRVHRRRGREAGARRREGDPGAARDQPRGHPRHARCRRDSDLDRRHDQPRRRGGARHGQALRGGRRRRAHRRQGWHALACAAR